MKIIYLANARIPTEKAHGYQIGKMCEEFGAAGAAVELWVPTRSNGIKVDAYEYYGLKHNFKIRYVKCFDFIRFDRFLQSKSVYLQSLWYMLKIAFAKISKDTFVFTRNPELAWLANWRGLQTAYECHDWFGKKKRIALWLLRKCDRIICTNDFIRQEFVKNGYKPEILVAPNGVNLEIFQSEIDCGLALRKLALRDDLRKKISGKKILLYAGSFRTMGVDKGIDGILPALKILHDPACFFLAVGGSEADIAYYEKIAETIGVAEQCGFIGRCPQIELALWQKAANILLMPFPDKAHYRHFMTPLKIFEYMASARPIIASDLPSIREILNDQNAFFCQPDNSRDLAEKIIHVLREPALAQAKAVRASADARLYAWNIRAERIFKFISG